MTGGWEGDGERTENCSISVDSPACSSYKHTPSTKRRRECARKADGRVSGPRRFSKAQKVREFGKVTARWRKKVRSALTDRPVPLISTLPRRTRRAQTGRTRANGGSSTGSVSENWIASRFEDRGFRVRVRNETIPRCAWAPSPGRSHTRRNVERDLKFSTESLILAQSER